MDLLFSVLLLITKMKINCNIDMVVIFAANHSMLKFLMNCFLFPGLVDISCENSTGNGLKLCIATTLVPGRTTRGHCMRTGHQQ